MTLSCWPTVGRVLGPFIPVRSGFLLSCLPLSVGKKYLRKVNKGGEHPKEQDRRISGVLRVKPPHWAVKSPDGMGGLANTAGL